MHKVPQSKRLVALAALALLLAGCAYRHVMPGPVEGIVYVLNTVVSQSSDPQPVLINGVRVARIRPGEFTWIRLAPGSYAITVSGAPFQGNTLSSSGVDIDAGQVRYMVYDEEENEPYLIEYSEAHARRWLRGKRFVSSRYVVQAD